MLAVFAAVLACTPLQKASIDKDTGTTQRLAGRRLLGMGPANLELEQRNDAPGPCFRRTPLMLAAEYGARDSAEILISSGASLEAVALLPELGDEALDARCLAIVNGHEALVKLLDAKGAKPRACTDNALLFAALGSGRADLVEHQLRAHPSGATLKAALRSAVGKRRGKAVDLLVTEAMTGSRPDLGEVFAAAAQAGDAELIRQLSAGGARIKGGAELAHAFASNQPALVEPLIAAGARHDTREVRAAIVHALRSGETGTLLALVDTGYRGDAEVPILVEAILRVPGIVPKLVKAGVGVEVDDTLGTTPLMAAASRAEGPLVDLLLERGASIRTANVECKTAHALKHASFQTDRLIPPPGPIVPGRAARQLGVTCGDAILSLSYPPTVQVFLPGGQRSIASGQDYRLLPGTHILRVQWPDGPERKMTVKLHAGMNRFQDSFDPARPLPALEAPPDVPPAAKTLELPEVLEVVDQHKADVAKCKKPTGTGDGPTVLTFRVGPDGATHGVDLAVGAGGFARCLRESVKTWKFPAGRSTPEPFYIPFNP